MKRFYVLFFLFLLTSIGFASALNCTYTEDVLSSKIIYQLYREGSKIDNAYLELNLEPGGCPYYRCSPLILTIYNRFDGSVEGEVYFTINGEQNTENISIDSLGYSSILRQWSDASHPISLDLGSVRFENLNNSLEAKKENFTWVTGEVCKQCEGVDCLNDGFVCERNAQCGSSHCVQGICSPNTLCYNEDCKCGFDEIQCSDNKRCVTIKSISLGNKPLCMVEECVSEHVSAISGVCTLRDGSPCSADSDCDADYCNPAGICGKFLGCPAGKNLCNNITCLEVSVKGSDSPYLCDWECTNGTIACDGVCRTISAKKPKEEYYCVQECKSGRGRDGRCLQSIQSWMQFIVIVLLVASGGVGYFAVYKKKRTDKERENAEKARDSARESLAELEKKILRLKEEEKEGDDKIQKLREKIEHAEGQAKTVFEEKLREQEKLQASQAANIEKLKKEESELREAQEGISRETKKLRDAAVEKYGGKEKVFINNEGYVQFKKGFNGQAGKLYHRWLYESKLPIGKNQEVHHIDGDKLNNEMWNLIALDREDHRFKVQEGNIKGEGWEYGLNYLLEKGIVREDQLHRYIKEHRESPKKKELS